MVASGYPTDQVSVLQAVVSLLQANIPLLSENNTCFLSLDDMTDASERQAIYGTVAPVASSSFDESIFVGSAAVLEHSGVVVTVFSQLQLDRPDAAAETYADPSRGLLLLKKQILTVLAGAVLLDGAGNEILVSPMRPIGGSHPPRNSNQAARFSLTFTTDFVWNLDS